jgi:hypothetical protein
MNRYNRDDASNDGLSKHKIYERKRGLTVWNKELESQHEKNSVHKSYKRRTQEAEKSYKN